MTAPVTEKYDAYIRSGGVAMSRWRTPHDVAQAVVTVATGRFPFSTGVHVDSGLHMPRLKGQLMALLGTGVLAIWNNIAPGWEREFLEWHVKEHVPERVGVQGFLRGRRYICVDGTPAYFNFYETETYQVLSSEPYQARLNDPTPWTRKVVSNFKDTSRTICDVVHSTGRGIAAWIETIQLQAALDAAEFSRRMTGHLLPRIQNHDEARIHTHLNSFDKRPIRLRIANEDVNHQPS